MLDVSPDILLNGETTIDTFFLGETSEQSDMSTETTMTSATVIVSIALYVGAAFLLQCVLRSLLGLNTVSGHPAPKPKKEPVPSSDSVSEESTADEDQPSTAQENADDEITPPTRNDDASSDACVEMPKALMNVVAEAVRDEAAAPPSGRWLRRQLTEDEGDFVLVDRSRLE